MDKPGDKTARGRLRAISEWLRGTATPPPATDPSDSGKHPGVPARIGHYTVTGKLGQGGMGIVYAARDERLGRTVALKTMSSLGGDETARKRFEREARAAASVNHPNVCQLYEIGEDDGELFIAMELLEGESLGERLTRGALSVAEAVPIALAILAALEALHARGIVHRDLKPSNVFLTPHGVKLLDFGLARPSEPPTGRVVARAHELTRTGMVLGTPRYMAPEQVTGDGLDARSDLFAVGAMLFEMLAGRPAFAGRNAVEILHATLYEQPPALSGSPAVAAVDRVIRRALAKRPTERPGVRRRHGGGAARGERDGGRQHAGAGARAHAPGRAAVPHPAARSGDGLPGLQPAGRDRRRRSRGIGSLVVRSSALAARFAGEAPDLKALATEADVDRVVMGTLAALRRPAARPPPSWSRRRAGRC